MQLVVDYAKIHKAIKLVDGSVRTYNRIAKADHYMPYINMDGTKREEYITKGDLFNIDSTNTLKLCTVTHLHPPEIVTPDNYKKYVTGNCGNIICLEDDFLGVVADIKDKKAIAAFDSGVKGWSPGYTRDLVKDSDNVYRQTNRKYNHISLVPDPRGGAEIVSKDSLNKDSLNKDSLDNLEYLVFDHANYDPNMLKLWDITNDQNDLLIDRLLTTGSTLNYINLDQQQLPLTSMNTKFKLGNKTLLIDSESVNDAVELASELTKLIEKTANVDSLKSTIAKLETELTIKQAEIDKANKDSKEINVDSLVNEKLKELAKCNTDLEVFSKYMNTDSAKQYLDKGDISNYKATIVKANSPSFDIVKDAAEGDIRYQQILDMASSRFFPNTKMSDVEKSSANNGNINSAIAGRKNGSLAGLPSDSNWS